MPQLVLAWVTLERPTSLAGAVKGRKVLVFGIGGGGDVVGALYMYLKVRKLGGIPLLGAVVWERYSVDPYPGPIPLESMIDVEPLGPSSALVTGSSYALRFGRELKPQLVRVAGLINEKALFIDISKGSEGVRQAIEGVSGQLGVEVVIGVDVGGDVLALGCEEGLWSPLADSVALAGLHASSGVRRLLAVHAPGADGELSTELVLSYVADIARSGGLIGIHGLESDEVSVLQNVVNGVVTEASLMPLLAFRGEQGPRRMREGTRSVSLSPVIATTYLLDVDVTYERSPLAKLVDGTMGISQARQVLNSRCIYTELDLEYDLFELRGAASERPLNVSEVRRQGIGRLVRSNCTPIRC
ncbi:MAG: DUF1152 domain-containing protein [Acidilobus sp.]